MILAYIAAVTKKIELVPSVIVLPARQTALFAKQAAELDILSGGRARLGIGIGQNEAEYEAQGVDFKTRGARCDEQMELLKRLWTEEEITYKGKFHTINEVGLNPLPIQQPIPMWIGPGGNPVKSVRKRNARFADGWFSLISPEDFVGVRDEIAREAEALGRDPATIGTEAGVAVVGPREAEWKDRIINWEKLGLTHLCLRTLGGGLTGRQHHDKMREAVDQLPVALS